MQETYSTERREKKCVFACLNQAYLLDWFFVV